MNADPRPYEPLLDHCPACGEPLVEIRPIIPAEDPQGTGYVVQVWSGAPDGIIGTVLCARAHEWEVEYAERWGDGPVTFRLRGAP